MKRCVRCIYPTAKVDLYFDDDGVCSACRAYDKRKEIDWVERKRDLLQILDGAKNDSGYDCIVASSGGKDSHFIALTLIELGVRPLVVTATTDHLSDIGRRNIANLARYADTIEVTPNQEVRRKISRIGLRLIGDISYGEHMAIWATPFQMAAKFGIPLVFYGECPQNEMGGPPGTANAQIMTPRWVSEFGGFLGLRATDLIGQDNITEADIRPYLLPEDCSGFRAYFLGQFEPWDGLVNAKMARDHGFEWWYRDVEGSIGAWESIDNHQTGIHEWFKFLKYGYMRPTDMASLAIRRGRMTQDEGLALIAEREKFPTTYLDMGYEKILDRIGVGTDEFHSICDRFSTKLAAPCSPDA